MRSKGALSLIAVALVSAAPSSARLFAAKKEKVREEVAVMDTNLGRVVFRFRAAESPRTVEAFKKLARGGFYDGTLFHRVLPGLLIEGGDPETREEPAAQQVVTLSLEENDLRHHPGTVSMAHDKDDLHSRSKFFICLQETSYFDGRHTIIGEIISGLKIVQAISNVPRNTKQAPLYPVRVRRIFLETQEFIKEVK